jgi:hypothetical protein
MREHLRYRCFCVVRGEISTGAGAVAFHEGQIGNSIPAQSQFAALAPPYYSWDK